MAEEAKTEEQLTGTSKKIPFLGKKKILIFTVVGLLIIILSGGGVFVFLFSKNEKIEKGNKKIKETVLIDLDPIVVNLFEPTGKRYLQIKLSLEIGDKKLEDLVKKNDSKIKDIVISYLSGKTLEDVLKPTAKEEIKRDLLQRINEILGGEVILNLYITQYLIE